MNNSIPPDLSDEVHELIKELNDAYASLYTVLASLTVVVYHIIISFDEEVRLIWQRPMSFPVVLYVFARYIQPFFYMLEIISSIWTKAAENQGVCDALANTANVLQIFFQIGVRGLLCLRAYALSRTKWLAIILLGSTFLADIAVYITGISMDPGCLIDYSTAGTSLITAELACGIANDTIILAFTVYELWERFKSKSTIKNGFGSILIKQGLLRYLFVIALAAQEMISIFTSSVQSEITGTLVTLFSSVMVTDFLLDLRRQNTRSSYTDETMDGNLDWSVARPAALPSNDHQQFSITTFFQAANSRIMADFIIDEDDDEIGSVDVEETRSLTLRSTEGHEIHRQSRSIPSNTPDVYQLEAYV